MTGDLRRVPTPTLEIAYDGVVEGLKGKGLRLLAHCLRGYGPTRILDPKAQPAITVPTIMPHGEADGVDPVGPTPEELTKFTDLRACRIIPIGGHNFPQEAPGPVAAAIEELLAARRADWSHRHDATPD